MGVWCDVLLWRHLISVHHVMAIKHHTGRARQHKALQYPCEPEFAGNLQQNDCIIMDLHAGLLGGSDQALGAIDVDRVKELSERGSQFRRAS